MAKLSNTTVFGDLNVTQSTTVKNLEITDSLTGNVSLHGNLLLTGEATTTNQSRIIDFTGFDKEGTTDFSDRAYIQHTINTGGHSGSVLVISSQNDSDDGIAFITNVSSQLKHNSNTIWDAGNDGSGSGLDADLLDGQQGSYYLDWANVTNKPDPTITLSGDASGSVTLTDLGNGTLNVSIVDDSHNHIISNIDGLQTALDGKVTKSGDTMTGRLILPASTTSTSSLRIPHGSSPTTLTNGDVWTNTTSILARINGSTRTFIHNGNPTNLASDVSEAEARAGTDTSRRWWTATRIKQAIESLTPESADDHARLLQLILTNDKYKVTEFDTPSSGDITETIKLKSDNSTYATIVTEFDTPSAGDITTSLTCSALGISNKVVTEFDTPSSGDITETGGVI